MKLTHPASGQVIEVLDGSEGRYVDNGWRPVVEAAPKKKAKESGHAPVVSEATGPLEGD